MRLGFFIFFAFLISCGNGIRAQEDFYDPSHVPEIRIRFNEKNWRHILDSLFVNTGDVGKLKADVTIDGITYHNAGIRYKGYSSYNADAIKNPFNIDLDYCITNQNHQGHTKIKLSNVIHDPSFVREVLAYEIARNYLPASRANFAIVFVNDTMIGLYTNVEAVDKLFINEHYQSDDHSFCKGEPVKLLYPFGENANLAFSHGTDSSGYIPYYKLESETGWNDLLNLISGLDKGPDSAATVLNIDRALWMHALNEVLLNLDSYIGYSQNYYIYRDNNGLFNPIIWDLNMSFGSFRESDGSFHFLGLTMDELKQLDPLEHLSFSVSPRPLITKLISDARLQKMYFAHIHTILNDFITKGQYYERGKVLQSRIDTLVARDTNRFYSYTDFLANMDSTVGGTGSMIKYPGLRDLMEARAEYLQSLPGLKNNPVISDINNFPATPVISKPVWITVRIAGAHKAILGSRFASGSIFTRTEMEDDGKHHDGIAGDSIYGAMLIPEGHTIQYYIFAENDSSAIFSPERAEYNFYTIQPEILPGDIVINEICSENQQENWIELLNTTEECINVSGMELADGHIKADKWIISDTLIQPKGYLLIYQTAEKGLILWNKEGRLVDEVIFGEQVTGKTIGRYPNGYGQLYYMTPTPSANNCFSSLRESGFRLFPNPAQHKTFIEVRNIASQLEVTLFNILGQIVLSEEIPAPQETTGAIIHSLDITGLESGAYIIKINYNGQTTTSKLIID